MGTKSSKRCKSKRVLNVIKMINVVCFFFLVFTPCFMLLCVVGSCCAKFETGQTFSHVQTDATTRNIVGQRCWELLRPFARSLKVILNLSNSIYPTRVIFLSLPAGGSFDAFSFTSLAIQQFSVSLCISYVVLSH